MNNWRFLLLAVVAVLQPIGSFTERNLIDGHPECCDHQSDLHGIRLYGSHRNNPIDFRHLQTGVGFKEERRYETRFRGPMVSRSREIISADKTERRISSEPQILTRHQDRRESRIVNLSINHRNARLSLESKRRDIRDVSGLETARVEARFRNLGSNLSPIDNTDELRHTSENRVRMALREERNDFARRVSSIRSANRVNSERVFRENRERDDAREQRTLSPRERTIIDSQSTSRQEMTQSMLSASRPSERITERRQLHTLARNMRERTLVENHKLSFEKRDSRENIQKVARNRVEVRRAENDQRFDSRNANKQSTQQKSSVTRELRASKSEERRFDTKDLRINKRETKSVERINERLPSKTLVNSIVYSRDRQLSQERKSGEERFSRSRSADRSELRRQQNERDSRRNTKEKESIESRRQTHHENIRNLDARDRSISERRADNRDSSRLLRTADQRSERNDEIVRGARRMLDRTETRRMEIRNSQDSRRLSRTTARSSRTEQSIRPHIKIGEDERQELHRDDRERTTRTNTISNRSLNDRIIGDRRFEARDVPQNIRRETVNKRIDERIVSRRHIEATTERQDRNIPRLSELRIRDVSLSRNGRNAREIRNIETRNRGEIRLTNPVTQSEKRVSLRIQPNTFNLRMEHVQENVDRSRETNIRNLATFRIRDNLVNEKFENEGFSANWQYMFFTLQGAYLCGLLMQMLNEKSNKEKTRNSWWISTSKDLIKVD